MIPSLALPLLLAALPYGPDPGFLPPEPSEQVEEASDGLLQPDPRGFLRWADQIAARGARDWPDGHPEAAYHFAGEVYADAARWVRARPEVVVPMKVGETAQRRPIWALRVARPGTEIKARVLIFAGIHALEWISVEVAHETLDLLARHPPDGVEVVVLPILNLDGRMRAEKDLLEGERRYRRANAKGVDLNRDFAVNRESDAIWQKIIPAYYAKSPAPLSQPESQAIDRLGATRFDVAVSLHSFGGFLYYPWSGLWKAPADKAAFETLGRAMAAGQGAHAYKVKQLSHWGFFFRALGSELDHLYGQYGTLSWLIELTRSGMSPLKPATWKDPYRFYNPVDPTRHVALGVGALRGLVGHLVWEGVPARSGSQN